MTLAEFERTLSKSQPPTGLAPALAALWWAGKDKWDKAHAIVMDDDGKDCAWVHAYLHRVEGDLGRLHDRLPFDRSSRSMRAECFSHTRDARDCQRHCHSVA